MNAKLAQRYLDDGMAVTPRPQLVVMLYERLLHDLRTAEAATREARVETAHLALVHAQDIVLELNLALDLDSFDGARNLRSIYDHLDRRLVEANTTKSSAIVSECIDVVAPLVETWQEVLAITQAAGSNRSTPDAGARSDASFSA